MQRFSLLLLICLLLPASARAESYRVDLIVFLDKFAATEQARAASAPELGKVLELDNVAALRAAGIEVLPPDQFALAEQWQHLKLSKRYQPLIKLAWVQKDPPVDRAIALHLKWGDTFVINGTEGASLMAPVDGSVALVLGHYLHLDADLSYTQKSASGNGYSSWHLHEKRRMKRDELHHLDSPRLGILTQVSKAQLASATP